MCSKKSYLTWQHASFDARELRQKHDEASAQVYRCKDCQAFHVGNGSVLKVRKPRPRAPSLNDRD